MAGGVRIRGEDEDGECRRSERRVLRRWEGVGVR